MGRPSAMLPDWNGAAVLPRETLVGQYCRLVPLDADSHAADLFDAYAQAPDDRDWTWLASSRPTSVEAAACWVEGKSTDASLVPYAVIEQRLDVPSDWCVLWRSNESTVRSKLVM
jgi:hypothetical protein